MSSRNFSPFFFSSDANDKMNSVKALADPTMYIEFADGWALSV